jgi:hypothetical protein
MNDWQRVTIRSTAGVLCRLDAEELARMQSQLSLEDRYWVVDADGVRAQGVPGACTRT